MTMSNDKSYATDQHGQLIYRILGHRYGDGQIDSDYSPVWLLGDWADLTDTEINALPQVYADE